MAKVTIAVRDLMGNIRGEACGEDQAVLVFDQEYKKGDTIHLSVERTIAFMLSALTMRWTSPWSI